MLADQIKRKVPGEVRDHFIDEWAEIISPDALVKKLDDYESVRRVPRNPDNGRWEEKTEKKGFPPKRSGPSFSPHKKPFEEIKEKKSETQIFEKRRQPRCYQCNSESHLRPECPELREKPTQELNQIRVLGTLEDAFKPYKSMGLVNGKSCEILRDSGASVDLTSINYAPKETWTGEKVWIQTPLEMEPRCLPLAQVKLEGAFGQIETKAAVVGKSLCRNRYLLSNRTAELIDQMPRSNHQRLIKVKSVSVSPNQEKTEIPENPPPTKEKHLSSPIVREKKPVSGDALQRKEKIKKKGGFEKAEKGVDDGQPLQMTGNRFSPKGQFKQNAPKYRFSRSRMKTV